MVRMKQSAERNPQISSVIKQEVEEIPVVRPESPPQSHIQAQSRKSSSASNHSVESDMLRKTSNDSGIGGIDPSSLIGEPRIAYPGAPSLVDLWKAQQARTDISKPKPRRAGTVEPPAMAGLQVGLMGLAGSTGAAGGPGLNLPNPYLLSMASAQAEMLKTHEQLINVFKQQANFLSSMAMCEPATLAPADQPPHPQISMPPTSKGFKRKARSDCTPITPTQRQTLQQHNSPVNVEDDNLSESSSRSAVSYQDDTTVSPPTLQTNITTSHSASLSDVSHLPNPVISPNQTHCNLTSSSSAHGNGSTPTPIINGSTPTPIINGSTPTPIINGPSTSNGTAAPKRKNAISALPTLNSTVSGESLLPSFSNHPSLSALSSLGLSPQTPRPSTASDNVPMNKLSTVSLPSTGRSANRKRARALPEDLKESSIPQDSQYWERRRKNNEAAKRSRDTRRAKEDEIAVRAAILQQENIKLHREVTELRQQLSKLTKERDTKKARYEERSPKSPHDDDEPMIVADV